jgi:hypothetical protein
MDQLEKRLNQLKNAYDEIPTTDKSTKIMEQIQVTEINKKKKNWVAQLPYVASFMGVLLIGAILVIQLLSAEDSTQGNTDKEDSTVGETEEVVESEEITNEDLTEKHQELLSFYNEQKQAFEQETTVPVPEELLYLQEIKEYVESTATLSVNDFQNKKQLEEAFNTYTEFIRDRFELPKTDLEQIDENTDVMVILTKQSGLLRMYQDQSTLLAQTGQLYEGISQDFFEGLDQLNNLEIENAGTLEFATEVLENGYHFIVVEGFYEVAINYQNYLDEYEKFLDEPVKEFITLKTERIATDGEIGPTWDQLAERLVKLENIKNDYTGTSHEINNEYEFVLNLYLKGADSSPAFMNGLLVPKLQESYEKVIAEYNGTETYSIVNEYYTLLKEGGFKKQAVVDFNIRD